MKPGSESTVLLLGHGWNVRGLRQVQAVGLNHERGERREGFGVRVGASFSSSSSVPRLKPRRMRTLFRALPSPPSGSFRQRETLVVRLALEVARQPPASSPLAGRRLLPTAGS